MDIYLRELQDKDADGMLEWMKDPEIVRYFRFDTSNVSKESCLAFIHKSDPLSRHYAIIDENDEYLGTISLKNITSEEAEYAISTRRKAHGKGVAAKATEEIFRIGFEELNLDNIYLNVLRKNIRANRFYEKIGFSFDRIQRNVSINGELNDLNWYSIHKEDYKRR